MIVIGWLIGMLIGAVGTAFACVAFGLPVPSFLVALAGPLAPIIANLAPWLAMVVALAVLILGCLLGYAVATIAIAPLLPGLVGVPVVFPLSVALNLPAAPVVPPLGGELFGRGMLIGITASTNSILLSLVPVAGGILAPWALIVVSLAIVRGVAISRVYHAFLGWAAWLLPLSWIATAVGLLLFLFNAPFALVAGGLGAFRIDFTTGVIETTGGLAFVFPGYLGFSVGNFNFIRPGSTGSFLAPSVSSHETGHALNTAAMGGIVLWINAIDENILPRRANLAYGEMCAESHARAVPGAPRPSISVLVWF